MAMITDSVWNTESVITDYPMLGQRRRRWANISPALGERVVFDRLHTHRKRLKDSAERSQVNQHVSTSVEGEHNNEHKPSIFKSKAASNNTMVTLHTIMEIVEYRLSP